MNRPYELGFIIPSNVPETETKTVIGVVQALIEQMGGKVNNVDFWGRRRLAYDIKKKSEGIYAILDINATPASVSELDRQLGLNESVLRTKVMRPEIR